MTKIILTIGGSDPFSGGGIQTDLKTFENHQVFGLSTLTCLATAPKNHFQIHDLETSLVKEQLASIPAGSLDGIKIGLIHSEESMLQIATFLKKYAGLPVVLDPVLAFKETISVYEKRYMQLLIEKLFPFATIITPNLKEAELLIGRKLTTVEEVQQAAEELNSLGAATVVIKGGNRWLGQEARDFFYDGQQHIQLAKEKVMAHTIDGAGCSFASAIGANLVKGYPLIEAVDLAKTYVHEAIVSGVQLNAAFGSVWHEGLLAGGVADNDKKN